MHQQRHPFSGDIYEIDGDGHVVVKRGELSGVFDGRGVHLTGALTTADPQLCNWLASYAEVRRRNTGLAARDRAAAFRDAAVLDVLGRERRTRDTGAAAAHP